MNNQRLVLAGVLLPLLMVTGFVAYAAWQRSGVTPPTHDLLFVTTDYGQYDTQSFHLAVVEQRVQIVVDDERQHYQPALYRLRVSDMSIQRVPLPEVGTLEPGQTLVLPALRDTDVIAGEVSPDGFSIAGYRDRGPGMFREIFANGGQQLALWKDGVRFNITARPRISIYNVDALGWVAP